MAAGTTATASPWVPVIAATVGAAAALIVGILTQLWSGRRQRQQWDREREDRQQQWDRERTSRQQQWQREDSIRWLQNRQQAYARLIAALYEWDQSLVDAAARGLDAAAAREQTDPFSEAAAEALPLVEFLAPEPVRSLAQKEVMDRNWFWSLDHLTRSRGGTNKDLVKKRSEQLGAYLRGRSELLDAMRSDLALEPGRGAAEPEDE